MNGQNSAAILKKLKKSQLNHLKLHRIHVETRFKNPPNVLPTMLWLQEVGNPPSEILVIFLDGSPLIPVRFHTQ